MTTFGPFAAVHALTLDGLGTPTDPPGWSCGCNMRFLRGGPAQEWWLCMVHGEAEAVNRIGDELGWLVSRHRIQAVLDGPLRDQLLLTLLAVRAAPTGSPTIPVVMPMPSDASVEQPVAADALARPSAATFHEGLTP